MFNQNKKIKFKKNSRAGMTMIEILIVIAVIGVLSTLVMISVKKVQNQAKDARRVSDIRELASALERYANDTNGVYPDDSQVVIGQPLVSEDKKTTYMNIVPGNPKPRNEGDCGDKEYNYTRTGNTQSYIIQYCLVNGVSGIPKGDCVAYPGAVCIHQTEDGCRCDDVKKACCGYCNAGSTCGGGTLYTKNFRIGEEIFDLIAATSGCNLSAKITDPDCSGVDSQKSQWSNTIVDEIGLSDVDGNSNTNILNAKHSGITKYPAANMCASLSINGFIDWYLPSVKEAEPFFQNCVSGNCKYGIRDSSFYWTSSQDTANYGNAKVIRMNTAGNPAAAIVNYGKTDQNIYLRCIRK